MIFAEWRLKAKVVQEDTSGTPSFSANSLPQKATESATITSGFSASSSRVTASSMDSVTRTISAVDATRSRATCPPSAFPASAWSQLMNRAPAASMAARKGSKL